MTKRKKTVRSSKHKHSGPANPKNAILAAALLHVPFDGFTNGVLARAAVETGVSRAELQRDFPDGPLSLVEAFSDWADAQMLAELAKQDLASLKVRERISRAVELRIAVLRPHKEATRRAAAFLMLPPNVGTGARLLYQSVDAIWRAIGDTSTDFNFYTKRGILAGVYGSTAMRWFNDTSEDEKLTQQFLAARIENVLQFEKFKSRAKEALSGFPMFADWAKKTK